ncbi:helix-turn-helix domain-containing protein [Streptosporangium sp. H16]|uniref:helix-turn-helix domain-containing protein n=1 Tax=Streptosporangium sp. H16 TaxID=3444184 RepID=UPI003F79B470
MRVHQAYRYALDPTPEQVRLLASHCGASRFAFNWGLARVKAALSQREAEKSYGVPDEHLTEAPWSLYGLRRAWNTAKGDVAPWWAEHSKEACTSGLDGVARALRNWAASRHGTRKGPKVGFARFRSKHRATPFVPVHHRCDPGGGRPPPRDTAPDRHHPHSRIDPETGPASGARHGADPVGHRPPRGGTETCPRCSSRPCWRRWRRSWWPPSAPTWSTSSPGTSPRTPGGAGSNTARSARPRWSPWPTAPTTRRRRGASSPSR